MNEKILILDDEETLCYFLKESLEEKGYQAVTAHTAREGLSVVSGREIDLVLLDLKLPDGDGLNVLYEIRKTHSDLPVIVLTGHAAVESAVQAMKLGAYDYLEKPINLAKLGSSVAQALESRSEGGSEEGVSKTGAARGVPTPGTAEAARIVEGDARSWGESAEMSRMYRQLERQIEEMLALDSISSEMMRSLKHHQLMEGTVDRLVQLPSVDMAAVLIGDGSGEEFVLAAQRRFPAPVWEDTALRRVPSKGLARSFANHMDGVLSLGEAGPDPWIERLKVALGYTVTVLLVPISHDGQLSGLVLVGRRGKRPFESIKVKTFRSIAQRLALAAGHATLLGSLRGQIDRLSKSEALHRGIVQNIATGVLVVDAGGNVRLLNQAAERLLGCKQDEVLGDSVEGCLRSGAQMVRDSLAKGLSYSGEEILVRTGDGEKTPLAMNATPLQDDAGKLNGVVVTLSDLREAKALEQEKRSLDRQAFLGDIAAVVAHEIRNPLAGIEAGVQHMLTKLEEGDERREAMGRVLKESERVNRIIEDILLISRPPHLSTAPCDVAELIEEVLSAWSEKASAHGIAVRKYCATGLPPVSGDRMRLHQAFSNLISSGIEAMPDGGELSIAVTGPGSVDGTRDGTGPASRRGASYLEIEIGDTAPTISQEDMEKIFEPFDRLKARGKGLGLAVAERIIDEHGGEVEVESREGIGTRFIARLPVAWEDES